MRKPVVGVMGGAVVDDGVAAMAERLGAQIAGRGWILLNGGRNAGVMAASARGAKRAGGMVVGVLPDHDSSRATGDLDIAIVTGMGDARNVINVLSCDVVIACPGGAGTLSEVALAIKSGKRVILLGWTETALLERMDPCGVLTIAADPAEAIRQTADALHKED